MARAREREAARASLDLLVQISRELNTPLDLHTVLQRVLQLSMENLGAINGSMIVLDDQFRPVDSIIMTGDRLHKNTTQQLRATLEGGLAGWVARTQQAALLPDTSQDERWLRRSDDALDRTGPKSALSAPVLAHDRLVGVVTLVHPKPGFFQPDHLSLLQIIADSAGIAVLNARLYEQSQRKARAMTALSESAMVITGSLDLEEVLQRILEQTGQALRVEATSLALVDPQTQELVVRAAFLQKPQERIEMRVGQTVGIAGWVIRNGRGLIVPDVSLDARFSPAIDQPAGLQATALGCAPVRSRGQVIGVLLAINPLDGGFEPDALLVLNGIGSLAGSTIRHAQLFERLQAAHQRYRDLFEDSINPILITEDGDQVILEANRQAEAITGLDRQALRSLRLEQLGIRDVDFASLTSGSTLSMEALLKVSSGQAVPVQVYARRVQIDHKPVVQWILQDQTPQKKLEQLRADLLSMAFHDLRSPLSNVISCLDLLQTLMPDRDPQAGELLEIAARSIARMQRLTNSLLDIQRLESGQPIGSRSAVPAARLIAEAVEIVKYACQNRDQDLSIDLAQDLPELIVDADMIRRVIVNLVENASKYSPHGGKISLSARDTGQGLQIAVQDNGPGIPSADREHIFSKFCRLDGQEGTHGLGLGLAFCRLAIEAHHGKIWVEDGKPSGAHIKLLLPLGNAIHPSANAL